MGMVGRRSPFFMDWRQCPRVFRLIASVSVSRQAELIGHPFSEIAGAIILRALSLPALDWYLRLLSGLGSQANVRQLKSAKSSHPKQTQKFTSIWHPETPPEVRKSH